MSDITEFVDGERSYISKNLIEAIDQGRCRIAVGGGVDVLTISRPDGDVSFFALRREGDAVVDHASGSYTGNAAPGTIAGWLREDLASGRRPWTNAKSFLHALSERGRRHEPVPEKIRTAAARVAMDFAASYDVMAEASADACEPYPMNAAEHAAREALYDVMRRATGVSREIIQNWPLAVPGIFDSNSRTFNPGSATKAVMAAGESVLRSSLPVGETAALRPGLVKALEKLRGFMTDEDNVWTIDGALLAFNDLPPEWIPDAPYHEDEEEWDTAIELGHLIHGLARATGRSPRQILKRFPGSWDELAYDVTSASGADVDSVERIFDAESYCRDMVAAFERQVVIPAMRCAGLEVEQMDDGKPLLVSGSHDPVRDAALRLLVGEKGIVGFAEIAQKWHTRVTDLAKVELSHGADVSWEVPFDVRQFPNPDGSMIEIRCLSSGKEFIEEGMDGKDEAGVDGLNHCIASYAGEARSTGNVVVSIRALDEGGRRRRLSTAYFAWDDNDTLVLKEHHGLANAAPPPAAKQAMKTILQMLRKHKRVTSHGDDVFFDPTDRDAVSDMISAWRFALPKAARNWSPEDLVAVSGFTVEPTASGPVMR